MKTVKKPHDSYQRLLDAFKEKVRIEGQKAIADWLTANEYETSPQMLSNWKTRGVPDAACVHIGYRIGADPRWIYFGDISTFADEPNRNNYQIRRVKSEDEKLVDELQYVASQLSTVGKHRLIERAEALRDKFPIAASNRAKFSD